MRGRHLHPPFRAPGAIGREPLATASGALGARWLHIHSGVVERARSVGRALLLVQEADSWATLPTCTTSATRQRFSRPDSILSTAPDSPTPPATSDSLGSWPTTRTPEAGRTNAGPMMNWPGSAGALPGGVRPHVRRPHDRPAGPVGRPRGALAGDHRPVWTGLRSGVARPPAGLRRRRSGTTRRRPDLTCHQRQPAALTTHADQPPPRRRRSRSVSSGNAS